MRSFGKDARKGTQQRQSNAVSKWESDMDTEMHR
jgi:hypothetical protein